MNELRQPRVAYLMSWFPAVTETFILYEILELMNRGFGVEIHPLLGGKRGAVHPGTEQVLKATHYHRFFSRELVGAQLHWLKERPRAYLRSWWRAVRGNLGSPGFLARALVVVPRAALIAQRVEAQGIQHVHAHWATHPALAAVVIQELTGIGYSITAHAHDLYVDRSMLGEKIARARFVVTISDFNHRLISSLFGHEADLKTFVIPCGVDPKLFRPRRTRPVNPVFTMACVASLRDYKGHRYLVEACAQLKARGVAFRCLLVGAGAERRRIQAQLARAGLLTEVELLGQRPQDQVREIVSSADAVVLPSVTTSSGKMEGIPVSLMEAMACEVPVVATAISGIPELVEDGRNGLLVPERDPAALAAALERLARDPALCRKLATRARQTVLERFDRAYNVGRLHALLVHVSGGLRRPAAGAPERNAAAASVLSEARRRRASPDLRVPRSG